MWFWLDCLAKVGLGAAGDHVPWRIWLVDALVQDNPGAIADAYDLGL